MARRYALLGLVVGVLLVASPAPAATGSTGITWTCLNSRALPYSITAGQTYATLAVSQDGNDR